MAYKASSSLVMIQNWDATSKTRMFMLAEPYQKIWLATLSTFLFPLMVSTEDS